MIVFGWSLITKAEKLLWLATIQDLKQEVERMRQERDHERARAEAALNALLSKTQGLALTPEVKPPDEAAINRLAFDIFGEEADSDRMREEQEKLDRIQGGRS